MKTTSRRMAPSRTRSFHFGIFIAVLAGVLVSTWADANALIPHA